MTERREFELRIERTFDASAEEVFDAWTSEEVLKRWFHSAPDWDTPTAEVDLRVGGKVRVAMREPDGTEHAMGGEYTLIERPNRLALTWSFDENPGNQQTIELEFIEREGRTTVVLINSGISTEKRRDEQDWGWNGCFDSLDRALAA
ncbi:MAG: SRPBCC family protein [Solirubrobacterales bacterium]